MRWINPLQWNFGPRTTATLLTWAVVPLALATLQVWRNFARDAAAVGITPAQVDAVTAAMLKNLLIVAIPLLVLCLIASALFAWVVVQPLWRLRRGMEAIAKGDLSQEPLPVGSRDEVGEMARSFNNMLSGLRALVGEMATNAGELDTAGRQLRVHVGETAAATDSSSREIDRVWAIAEDQVEKASGGAKATGELQESAEQVAMAAEAQAQEVQNAAETVRQVTIGIEQVAHSAGVVSEAALQTRTAADAGVRSMQAVAEGMERVRDRVLEASEEITALSGSLSHVDEILHLISEIADQTDLLALNAAIEAARVGEQGRGFAVVAGEVRRLAERSRRAAGEIGGRVAEIRQGAVTVVTTMGTGTTEVNAGVALVQGARESLERILDAARGTERQVDAISSASEEIRAASGQVARTTEQLAAIAEENAAIAAEMVANVKNVAAMIAEVEHGALENQVSTGTMAGSSTQVKTSVAEIMACSSQVKDIASVLHQRVSRFKLV